MVIEREENFPMEEVRDVDIDDHEVGIYHFDDVEIVDSSEFDDLIDEEF